MLFHFEFCDIDDLILVERGQYVGEYKVSPIIKSSVRVE